MFSTRLRSSTNIIDYLLIYDISDSEKGCLLEYYYPETPKIESEALSLKEFVFPCSHRNALSEEYTLILTDSDGKLDFVSCICLPTSGYIVCLRSPHPWFELFHCLLLAFNQRQLCSVDLRHSLGPMIDRLSVVDGHVEFAPSLEGSLISDISIPIPGPRSHPFYQRFILEYYNTLSISNWIVVFESLILEKSMVFYSNRFQRISSCVLASVSLLYPLIWAHLIYPIIPPTCVDVLGCPSPFIAGIHSCAIEQVKQVLSEGVRLVDLDNDVVYINGSSEQRLPNVIRHWLLRRCYSSYHLILRRKRTTQAAAAACLVEPFLEVMSILLGGYREAMSRKESGIPKTGTSTKSTVTSNWTFDTDVFVNTRGRDCQTYLRELLHSQMVHQFIESRLADLNSDFGMVEQDDFEDCITRVPIPVCSNLSDLLVRGRRGFGHLAKRLGRGKFKRSDQSKLSSESSSSDTESPKAPETTTADGSSRFNLPPRERSLLASIIDSVPDTQKEWLRSGSLPAPTQKQSACSRELERKPFPPKPVSQPTAVNNETQDTESPLINLLEVFDPYHPEPRLVNRPCGNNNQKANQIPPPTKDDLSQFLRTLDPLITTNQNEDLLK